MDNFLWSQAATLEEKNIYVIDGVFSRYSGTLLQKEAMEVMSSFGLKYKVRHKEGEKTSPAFYVKEKHGLIQLSGNFLEKDEVGRFLVYVFTTRQKDIKAITDTLISYSKIIGLTLNETDIHCFEDFFQIRRKKKKWVIILLLLLVFVVLSHLLIVK